MPLINVTRSRKAVNRIVIRCRHEAACGGLQANASRSTDEINRHSAQIKRGKTCALIHQYEASKVADRKEPTRLSSVKLPMNAASPLARFGSHAPGVLSGAVRLVDQIAREVILI